MILSASRLLRNRAYQFFLVQHVTLWFVIVASLVVHRPQDQGWIWAGFVPFIFLAALDVSADSGAVSLHFQLWLAQPGSDGQTLSDPLLPLVQAYGRDGRLAPRDGQDPQSRRDASDGPHTTAYVPSLLLRRSALSVS